MATTTEVNATLIRYDASGDQTVIYPKTLGTDIEITSNSYYSTTNLQTLVGALGSLAFRTYTIVTSIENAVSGTLVDGDVIASIQSSIEELSVTIESLSETTVTYSVMTGASSSADGAEGLVPAPSAGQESYFLRGDGKWVSLS